ncbi:efflux RND transporter periplasmic adaptor subunit [Actinoplanes sp. CA-252034]|uniref:efflux RND transporter periplasmic adaptor subunit n=1 Tax=Actinoplanes sp. CA-252034 TaxID=3239906 RepID=UPI003D95BC50
MGVALAGRRRLIWLAVAVVVLALIAFGVVRALTAGAAQEESKAAEIVKADRGTVTTEVATTGTLQAAQTRSLSFAVSAEVESVKVRAGNTVTAGQVLATVDDTAAAEKVDDATSTLSDAYDALESAQSASTSAATSGCNVAAAYTSTSPGVSASASPSASPSPSSSPSVSPSPTPARTTTKPRATATKTCATSTGGSTRGGSGGDAILSAQQRVNAAEVALEEAEENLAGATIKAPIAGKIISVSGKVGSTARSGSAFITLADVYDMQISADFPEADADHLEVTQKAVITLADRPGETFDATVVQVDPVGTSDGTLTRFGVVLSFNDAPDELLVGQSANVRVTTGSEEDVLRVPSTAVHDVSGDSGTVLKGGAEVQVKLGLRGDRYTEIASGITEGDPVAKSW